jgi:hypothetical protein
MEGIKALSTAISIAASLDDATTWLDQAAFELAVGGILKLGMEKLEPVRAASWRAWREMRDAKVHKVWKWDISDIWTFATPDDR